jgi:hypothetical protein
VTRLQIGRPGFDSWRGKFFSSPQRPDRLWGPTSFLAHHQGDRPDNGGSTYLWNVGKILRVHTAQLRRRQSCSHSPPWEPEISTHYHYFMVWLVWVTSHHIDIRMFTPFWPITIHNRWLSSHNLRQSVIAPTILCFRYPVPEVGDRKFLPNMGNSYPFDTVYYRLYRPPLKLNFQKVEI